MGPKNPKVSAGVKASLSEVTKKYDEVLDLSTKPSNTTIRSECEKAGKAFSDDFEGRESRNLGIDGRKIDDIGE